MSEKEQPIEEWFSLPFSHSDKTISDLPTGIPQFVDTFYVAKSQLDQLKLPFFPKQYESFLKKSGTFTARIYVVADNVSVKSKEIKFQWSAGSFDSLKIIDNESQYSDDSM